MNQKINTVNAEQIICKENTPVFVKLIALRSSAKNIIKCTTKAKICNRAITANKMFLTIGENLSSPLLDCHPTNKDVLIRTKAIAKQSTGFVNPASSILYEAPSTTNCVMNTLFNAN